MPSGSLPELFHAMEWNSESTVWDGEGDLWKAIAYARGSKLLNIPNEWRWAIPTAI